MNEDVTGCDVVVVVSCALLFVLLFLSLLCRDRYPEYKLSMQAFTNISLYRTNVQSRVGLVTVRVYQGFMIDL